MSTVDALVSFNYYLLQL